MLRMLILAMAATVLCGTLAQAQQRPARPPISQCQAIASTLPGVTFASVTSDLQRVQASKEDVKIQYIGHSTFLITSPEGVTIATDYNGVYCRQ